MISNDVGSYLLDTTPSIKPTKTIRLNKDALVNKKYEMTESNWIINIHVTTNYWKNLVIRDVNLCVTETQPKPKGVKSHNTEHSLSRLNHYYLSLGTIA